MLHGCHDLHVSKQLGVVGVEMVVDDEPIYCFVDVFGSEVGLLSIILASPAVIGMEAVTIVMRLLRAVRNRAIKKMSLKIEKHFKIAMLSISSLNTTSSLISNYQMTPFQMKNIH